MPKKRDTVLTVVTNDLLYFLLVGERGNITILHHLPLGHFLSEDRITIPIPEELKQKVNTLLIVPDYWFGSAAYNFQSTTKSLVEAFIERKLQTEHPDRTDILDFFDYTFYPTARDDQGLYVFFLQEPKSFQLYSRLVESKLSPRRITTPAYLWEQKLIKKIPNFQVGGTGLVHLLSSACHLYFYSRGHFLFSRSIAIPDSRSELSERLDALAFEINQSLYLYSQKAKADIDHFFLLSSDEGIAQGLSEILRREVKDLNLKDEGYLLLTEADENLGPVESFNASDLSSSAKYPYLIHKLLKKELEWKPIQIAGIIIGLILVLMLGVESFFLQDWYQPRNVRIRRSGISPQAEPKQIIQEYNDALDLLLREKDRPSVKNTIIRVAEALPDNAWIKEMVIETETNPNIDIKGIVYAHGSDHLRDSLTIFLSNLNAHFRGSTSISIQDIDFEALDSKKETEYQAFLFTFKFDLP